MKQFAKIFISSLLVTTATTVLAATPTTPQTASLSAAQKDQIQQVVHEYLVAHPEVLVEAAQSLQRKQFEETQQTVKQTQQTAANFADALFHQKTDPTAGNPNGKVTVVEFFDYQCPHCVDMAPVMAAIIKANPNLRVIYKEFPIRGAMSEFAARAALAANQQGKYVAFSHALLTANQPLTQDLVFQLAKNVGMNVDQLKKDMNSPVVDQQLKANLKLAQDLKLFGTPALFIGLSSVKNNNGQINYVPGQMDQSQLQSLISQTAK